MSKQKPTGGDASPPTQEQFAAFVRKIAAVPKAEVDAKSPTRAKGPTKKKRGSSK